jgi:phage FluMu protein Com
MQIRCSKCQMPIPMTRDIIFSALDIVMDEDLPHYDIKCPKCRKTNRVSKKQLLHAGPTWKRESSDSKEE